MAANKMKAERFLKEVSDFARQKREELGIDRSDLHLVMRVDIVDRVVYDEHEDED